jgi:hypothetical protein
MNTATGSRREYEYNLAHVSVTCAHTQYECHIMQDRASIQYV